MEELVLNQNGKLVTNSLLIAKKFGKLHKDVLKAIRNIMDNMTAENCAVLQMFIESEYYNEQSKKQTMFVMDRDGFSLLVMGFTGKEAMKFKIDFIRAFNEMESKLKLTLPKEPEELLLQSVQLMIEQKKRLAAVEIKVNELEAKTLTRPEYFTVVGYCTLNKIKIGLQLASKMGQKATRICKLKGYPMDDIPDPRFGRVHTYPKSVLQEIFNEPINILT